jgi:hypothetical protein
MERDATGVGKGDPGEGAVEPLQLEDAEEDAVQRAADPAPARVLADVRRDVDRPSVRGARAMFARVDVADDRAFDLAGEPRPPLAERRESRAELRRARRRSWRSIGGVSSHDASRSSRARRAREAVSRSS